jgi:NADH:ubiquinone reductase (H+-translocating)
MRKHQMGVPRQVVIVGGGFGGLFAARALKRTPIQVTLIDRRNFHLFQPLLYQVATGGLSPANIAAPLRVLLKHQRNTEVRLGEVVDFDVTNRQVLLSDTGKICYDTLIVATGSAPHYFGHDDWKEAAPPLKSIADAAEIRRRVLLAFEAAELATDPDSRRTCLTFVVVGGGTSGVELTGCLSELAHHTLKRDFRHIDPGSARIVLVEGGDRVLPSYPPKLSAKAAAALARLGVEIQTCAVVTKVGPSAVTIRRESRTEHVGTRTILWAAGVQASPLGRILAEKTGAQVDKKGRIEVQPDLTILGHPELFVLGDLAHFEHQGDKPLPGVAPVAMQQGRYVADLIGCRLRGQSLPSFHYKDRGSMAVIGRNAAVADLGWLRIAGFPAWLLWLFIHLLYLAQFQNRLLVLAQWSWNYITRNRSALLIPERRTDFSAEEIAATGPPSRAAGGENEMSSSAGKEKVES